MKKLWVRLSLGISGVFIAFLIIPAFCLLTIGFFASSSSSQVTHIDRSDFPRPPDIPIRPERPEFDFEDSQFEDPRFEEFDTVYIDNSRGPFLFGIPIIIVQSLLCIGLMGTVAGAVVSRSVTRPVTQLSQAAKSIGDGDLSQRVSIKGSQELTDLATSFNQMAYNLENAETLRKNLMADVSHELRTPLTILEGNLQAALDHVYDLDDEELANLYQQTRHLIHLVEDLNELALAEANKLPLNKEKTDIPNLLNDLIAIFAPYAEEKAITLTSQIPATVSTAHVDGARLRQVLDNLVSNALRHTPSGGNVTLIAGQTEGWLTIQVQDTGNGITPDQLPHIFDRFYRADRSRSRDTGGTGLGLAIVKAIVETHGGRVYAESIGNGVPKGSRFTVQLPIAKRN